MEKVLMKTLVRQVRGVSYKPEDLHDSLDESSVILLRANNIDDGKINFNDVVFVDRKKVSQDQLLQKGDILICASSGSKHLVGKAATVDFDEEVTFGAFCKVVRPSDSVNSDYISMYFQSPSYREEISSVAIGVNINNIRNEHIDALRINWPSAENRRDAVAVLSKAESVLHKRKEEIQALNDLIKARFVEMFGDPVSNPKGWEKKSLSDEAEIKIGPFGSLLHKEDYITGGHALVNPSHIVSGKIVPDNDLTVSDKKYSELEAYHLKEGDVVMGRRGEMGRCAVVEETGLLCGTGSLLIRSNGDLSADYIQKIISFPSFKRAIEDMAVGQTMPNLNVPIVSSFRIIKPPKSVQDQYYTFVAQVEKSKAAVQKALVEAQLLFDSLMQQYFG